MDLGVDKEVLTVVSFVEQCDFQPNSIYFLLQEQFSLGLFKH